MPLARVLTQENEGIAVKNEELHNQTIRVFDGGIFVFLCGTNI